MIKISKLTIGTSRYVAAPAEYDAQAITHADAQQDSQITLIDEIEDVLDLLSDEPAQAATLRAADEWIEACVCGGEVSLDEATHDDLLAESEDTVEVDEYDEADAQRLARQVLAGSDLSMSWRDAGYGSALAAARVLVGDGGVVEERAAEIVADELTE